MAGQGMMLCAKRRGDTNQKQFVWYASVSREKALQRQHWAARRTNSLCVNRIMCNETDRRRHSQRGLRQARVLKANIVMSANAVQGVLWYSPCLGANTDLQRGLQYLLVFWRQGRQVTWTNREQQTYWCAALRWVYSEYLLCSKALSNPWRSLMWYGSSSAVQCCVDLTEALGKYEGDAAWAMDLLCWCHVRVKGLSWVQQCVVFLDAPWLDLSHSGDLLVLLLQLWAC